MTAVLFAAFAGIGAFTRWKACARGGKLGLDGPIAPVLGTAGIGAMTTVSGLAQEVHSLSALSKARGAFYLAGTLKPTMNGTLQVDVMTTTGH